MNTWNLGTLRFTPPTGFTDATSYVLMSGDKGCSLVLRREIRPDHEPFEAACERQVKGILEQLTGFKLIARVDAEGPYRGERLDLRVRYGEREVLQRVVVLDAPTRELLVVCATYADEAARDRWSPAVAAFLQGVVVEEVA